MSQSEIVESYRCYQSTVSIDLQQIRHESRKYIETYVTKDIPFEFYRCLTGLDQIRKIMGIVEEEDNNKNSTGTTNKDRMSALSLLMQCYSAKLEYW